MHISEFRDMKHPTIFEGLDQQSLMPGWLVLLFMIGGVCSLSGCGKVNELAREQLAAETEHRQMQDQLSAVNKNISQVQKDNAASYQTMWAQDRKTPADRERAIQDLELRVKELQTAKKNELKRLDEAKGFLAAQQSRRRR